MDNGNESVWELSNHIGRQNSRALSCEVDAARPERGLNHVAVQGIALEGTFLSISRDADNPVGEQSKHQAWPAALADVYVRGDDLVASYAASDDWPYAAQIYWRADSLNPVQSRFGSLSVLISVQTHLLDTHPEISLMSRLGADEMLQVTAPAGDDTRPVALPIDERQTLAATSNPRCCLWRLRGSNVSYIEMMPGSDFRELAVERREDGSYQARWRVFADFLEKGVIRRAQLQAAFLPRENDIEHAAVCCRALERRPLPLTA